MSAIKDRRLGAFKVSVDLLDSDPASLRAVMAQVIVLRAKYRMDTHEIEYLAQCDAFAPVPIGNLAPTYRPTLHRLDDGTVEFLGWT